MAEPSLTFGIKELFEAGIIGLGGFFMWLLKRSIFGRMDDQDKKLDRLRDETQSKAACIILQGGCQRIIGTQLESVEQLVSARHDKLEEKIDLVLDRQKQVITRIDAHINGHKHDS